MNERDKSIEECYHDLAGAIVAQACDDYIGVPDLLFETSGTRSTIERFFRSDLFYLYTDGKIEPDALIEMLKEKRKWNVRMKRAILDKYGNYRSFAEVVYPMETASGRYMAIQFWLQSSRYPKEWKRWEEAVYGKGSDNKRRCVGSD